MRKVPIFPKELHLNGGEIKPVETEKSQINGESIARSYKHVVLFLAPLVLLMVAFSPSFAPFGIHNDYSFLELKSGDWWLRYDESWLLYRVGRPLAGALMSFQMLLMKSPESFVYWRIAGVIMAGVIASQFAKLLRARAGYSLLQSVCWGTLFLLLPAFQISVVWLTMVFLGLAASFIGLLGYSVIPDISGSLSLGNLADSFRKDFLRYIAAAVLFIVAMLIYPINALVGLVVTAAIVLSQRRISEKVTVVLRDGIIFGVSMLAYLILVKSQILPLAKGEIVLPMYQLKLSFAPMEQLENLVNILAISAASPWHVIAGMPLGIVANLILLSGLVFLVRKRELPRLIGLATVSALLLLVIVIANAPVLVAPKGFYNAYRTGFTSQAIVWLIVGAAISTLAETQRRVSTSFVYVIVFAALGCTFYNCALVRKNCSAELTNITAAASRAISEKRDIVYFLKTRSESFDGWPPRFEFALPVTHAPHLAGALSGMYERIAAARINIGAVDENGMFRLIYGNMPDKSAFVFDMRSPDPVFWKISP
jgi:hypothetical protein